MSEQHALQSAQTFETLASAADLGRFDGIQRAYTSADVIRLRGSLPVVHTLAEHAANKLWRLLHSEDSIAALGAVTGNQAVQSVRAGLKAIYLSGWQVAADNNTAGSVYPDQSLYPVDSGPELCRRINKALQRADQIEVLEGKPTCDWFAPVVADAEAGFGGPLNAYEIMKAYIEAGAAGVHFEDQLSSEKKCGHLGGKVLVPTGQHIRTLIAARLAADVAGTPTLVLARTDAESACLITSDIDERDRAFISGDDRTPEGFYRIRNGVEPCIARGLAYAPYADLLWWETSTPSLAEARRFAEAIHRQFPRKLLAYNCSPSFNWGANLDETTISRFQNELAAMGYKFQFVTLAGFHQLSHGMFELARDFRKRGMSAYSDFQQAECRSTNSAYTAVRQQREAGTPYFDEIAKLVAGGRSSTRAMADSTEAAQFHLHAAESKRAGRPSDRGDRELRQAGQ